MTQPLASSLRYALVPGRFAPDGALELYQALFEFWHQNWSQVYKDLGTNKRPCADDFLRQDWIAALLHEQEVVAIHNYHHYDLRCPCHLKASYLEQNFTPFFWSQVKAKGLSQVMSMEALFVSPAWRKAHTGVSLAGVIIALGQRLFILQSPAQALVAPARKDNPTSALAQAMGFEIIQADHPLNNVKVDLLLGQREGLKPPPCNKVSQLTESLWAKKESYLPHDFNRPILRAA